MCEFEERYPENIKKFLLSKESNNVNIISRQNRIMNNICKHQNLDENTSIEYYNEIPFEENAFFEKCDDIFSNLPIKYFIDEYINIIINLDLQGKDINKIFINYGDRISLDKNLNKKFEEWRNVLSREDEDIILFSLHKTFIDDKFEIKTTYKSETTILELILRPNAINSVKFTKMKGNKKYIYLCVPDEDNTKIVTTLTLEDEDDKTYESKTENLNYNVDYSKIESNSDNKQEKEIKEEENPITVSYVDTECIKTNSNTGYYEKNFETYNIEPDHISSWGKKNYENNQNRKYNEEWHRTELENGGYELKCQKFLDDGCGKKTTEMYGKKYDGNDMEYEYTDTCIYDVTNGDELTTKKGFDKYNNWNCRNYRNKIKDFSHVENIASNKKDKMEWREKWDEEKNMKTCTKWGRSENEEWEESWKEIYNPETDDSIKECYKKCKQLNCDKEWYETWTEKNNGKSNCEKTCYKMNKENGNKYENYWGNIIVNYLDNKRMNYVGYITNDKKDEYINYTYENTNN